MAFISKVVKQLAVRKIGKSGDEIRLSLSEWNGKRVLVNQNYFTNEDGEEQAGKIKAITADDWAVVKKNAVVIDKFFA